ncbi:hypothetical protein DACRYDRAFT_92166 [Dacryopinax primogenitus]|uniref:E3 ubiquitin-protein ligase PEP5 n=1 Tax=Dacryopinax primogenitus (strain DJM 731) TaxID=1858805 RepID=M5GAQ0_DACPD|nr:uncharacterized protein DACRYDRAFT_92166 [Dacryopinax primogenitus]EJU05949.1 hypothetical protein DACRYDRAFT_92166 [Dacryopinax primogenitus]
MASVGLAPRQFTFFDSSPVKDAQDLANPPAVFHLPTEIVVIASSTVGILVADIHGVIHVLDRKFERSRGWVAFDGGRVTHMLEKRGILITLGEEAISWGPLLKIWDLVHTDKRTDGPVLLRSVKVGSSNKPFPVSTMALSSTLSHLSIGLGDGTVLLYRNLDQSLFSGSSSLTALPRARTVHEGTPAEPITGLGFRESPAQSQSTEDKGKDAEKSDRGNMYLFIVTTAKVLVYIATGRGSGGSPQEVDEVGCGLGCAVMDKRGRYMVVARDEALYLCGPEGREPSYAYEGPKSFVQSYRSYIIIVSPPFTPSVGASSTALRQLTARADSQSTDVSRVTIFDLENKYIAFTSKFEGGVKDVVCEWGSVFVLCNDGKLFRLEEKSTPAKLDLLYQRSEYALAIRLAQSLGVSESGISDIYRRRGDFLYSKGDYDGAMEQFLHTLSYLQPSYVIRKFLDAQRIHNLTTYLQELHSQGLANSDHTTLLLNTYTKLKDVGKLDAFIRASSVKSKAEDGERGEVKEELPFDLDTAIRVCRQAGYYEHAAYLARKWGRHEDYLRIQIEDAGRYGEALGFLRRLGPEATEHNIARYGRALLSNLPDQTTQLLIELCTGAVNVPQPTSSPELTNGQTGGGASYLSYITNNPAGAILTGLAFSNATPAVAPTITVSQAETAARVGQTQTPTASRPETPPVGAIQTSAVTQEKRPSPRLFFAHFVGHTQQFVRFLEAVALYRWGQSVEPAGSSKPFSDMDVEEQADSTAVWNTLLELYLSQAATFQERNPSISRVLHAKATRLLQQDQTLPYDQTHALMVCSTQDFTEGLVLLWEKMGAYEDILRYYMDQETAGVATTDGSASTKIIQYLDLYGPQDHNLYPLVLRFLTLSPALLSRHTQDVVSILDTIETEKIMPPVGVLQVLSRNHVASVGVIKMWLMKRIAETRGEIEADHHLIESYQKETKEKEQEIKELTDPNHPRVFHVTNCSGCGHPLTLPAVHFMCKHSYHQRCVSDQDPECPNCARAHGLIKDIRRHNARVADQHKEFLADVGENGFSAIAAAFGQGVMSGGKVEETPV